MFHLDDSELDAGWNDGLVRILFFADLHRNHDAPRGWHWKSFEHHHRLQAAQRLWVLPAGIAARTPRCPSIHR